MYAVARWLCPDSLENVLTLSSIWYILDVNDVVYNVFYTIRKQAKYTWIYIAIWGFYLFPLTPSLFVFLCLSKFSLLHMTLTNKSKSIPILMSILLCLVFCIGIWRYLKYHIWPTKTWIKSIRLQIVSWIGLKTMWQLE